MKINTWGKSVSIALFLLSFISLSAQESINTFSVNAMNVRLRGMSSINSPIIQVFNKGDIGQYVEKNEVETDPEFRAFNWFNVIIEGKSGWFYGEFIDLKDERLLVKKNRLSNSNEIQIVKNNQTIYLGMKKEDVVAVLGLPEKELVEKDISAICLFYSSGKLYIEIDEFMKCVKYIKIEDPEILLASGIHVGMSIDEILNVSQSAFFNIRKSSITPKTIFAPNYNSWYAPWLSIDIDESRIITAIYLGLNVE